jgi:uncharacterized lipoprotein YajG
VRDERKEDDKIFAELGIVTYYERSKGIFELVPDSQEIVSRSLKQAMTSSGYILRDNARIVIDVIVQDFIYCIHSDPVHSTVNIKLGVSVMKDGDTLLRKTIAEEVKRKPGGASIRELEEMFSECLSRIVEKVVSDYNVTAAVKNGHEAK